MGIEIERIYSRFIAIILSISLVICLIGLIAYSMMYKEASSIISYGIELLYLIPYISIFSVIVRFVIDKDYKGIPIAVILFLIVLLSMLSLI